MSIRLKSLSEVGEFFSTIHPESMSVIVEIGNAKVFRSENMIFAIKESPECVFSTNCTKEGYAVDVALCLGDSGFVNGILLQKAADFMDGRLVNGEFILGGIRIKISSYDDCLLVRGEKGTSFVADKSENSIASLNTKLSMVYWHLYNQK